jgi:hypothetical protein
MVGIICCLSLGSVIYRSQALSRTIGVSPGDHPGLIVGYQRRQRTGTSCQSQRLHREGQSKKGIEIFMHMYIRCSLQEKLSPPGFDLEGLNYINKTL